MGRTGILKLVFLFIAVASIVCLHFIAFKDDPENEIKVRISCILIICTLFAVVMAVGIRKKFLFLIIGFLEAAISMAAAFFTAVIAIGAYEFNILAYFHIFSYLFFALLYISLEWLAQRYQKNYNT